MKSNTSYVFEKLWEFVMTKYPLLVYGFGCIMIYLWAAMHAKNIVVFQSKYDALIMVRTKRHLIVRRNKSKLSSSGYIVLMPSFQLHHIWRQVNFIHFLNIKKSNIVSRNLVTTYSIKNYVYNLLKTKTNTKTLWGHLLQSWLTSDKMFN